MSEGNSKYTPIRRISHSGSITARHNAFEETPCAEIWERRDDIVNADIKTNMTNGDIERIDTEVEYNEVKHIEKNREQWTSRGEFLLTCIGLSVGLSNIWRFPYYCAKNTGGRCLVASLHCT